MSERGRATASSYCEKINSGGIDDTLTILYHGNVSQEVEARLV
jgi:hypothetical protein